MSGFWASAGDFVSSGVDTVEGWFGGSSGADNFQQPDYTAMEEVAFGSGKEAEKELNAIGAAGALNSGHENAWLGKVLGPAMQSIMGTAMKPKSTMRAPLGGGGHGVNASGGTAAKVPDTIMKLASDDPLSNIQQFSRLFE